MTAGSLSRRDIERKLDALEGDEEPPAYVCLEELRDGICPPGTPSIAEMLSGQSETDLLVDAHDGSGSEDSDVNREGGGNA